jgi:hypothetical protein
MTQVAIQFGRAEFIGDTQGTGSDRAQRDRARDIYEKVIDESPVRGSAENRGDDQHRWSAPTAEEVAPRRLAILPAQQVRQLRHVGCDPRGVRLLIC